MVHPSGLNLVVMTHYRFKLYCPETRYIANPQVFSGLVLGMTVDSIYAVCCYSLMRDWLHIAYRNEY